MSESATGAGRGAAVARSRPAADCLQDRFLSQVAHAPDAPAIQAGDQLVTFRALDRRANQMAHRLLADGVLPGAAVAVDLRRSIDLVATLLGIWKAGAYYLPLQDSDVPHWRDLVVRHSGARVLVTDRAPRRSGVPSGCHLVDANFALDGMMPDSDLSICSEPGALALVVFTAGQAESPTELHVTHADLLDVASGGSPHDRREPDPMAALLAPDTSVYDLWVPLLNGGCSVLAPSAASTCW
jgi:non-ribosomal peptide synthetase component F